MSETLRLARDALAGLLASFDHEADDILEARVARGPGSIIGQVSQRVIDGRKALAAIDKELAREEADEDDEVLHRCEKCEAQSPLEEMIICGYITICNECHQKWLAEYHACEHDWDPEVTEDHMGDPVYQCRKCDGVKPVEAPEAPVAVPAWPYAYMGPEHQAALAEREALLSAKFSGTMTAHQRVRLAEVRGVLDACDETRGKQHSLTRPFSETVTARAAVDQEFRQALAEEDGLTEGNAGSDAPTFDESQTPSTNDNPKPSDKFVMFSDLVAESGISEDEMLHRLARILAKRIEDQTPKPELVLEQSNKDRPWWRCRMGCQHHRECIYTTCRASSDVLPQTPSTPPWLTPAVQERATAEVQRVLAEQGMGATSWLIERSGQWWAAGPCSRWDWQQALVTPELWTSDPNTAVRFARKADAETLIHFEGWKNVAATEHRWIDHDVIPSLATQIVLAVLAACVPSVEAMIPTFHHALCRFPFINEESMRAALLAAMRGEA
jgi:hypothetical protein